MRKQQYSSNAATCVVIPTYNHANTLAQVVESVLSYTPDVIVVNDGSTDQTPEILKSFGSRINSISYKKNRGKGYALKMGFDKALELGFGNVITIDSDGQHFASDIPNFIRTAKQHPNTLILGSRLMNQENMPSGNKFANKFSNFWFTAQTGIKLTDTQTGYRLYPLERMKRMRPTSYRYEAELELLVRSAWRGIKLIPIPIDVYYPEANERISHFKPSKDFFRISVLNTLLCFVAIFYGYPRIFLNWIIGHNS